MIEIGNLFFFLLHLLRSLGVDVILDQIADNVEAHLYLTFFMYQECLICFPSEPIITGLLRPGFIVVLET